MPRALPIPLKPTRTTAVHERKALRVARRLRRTLNRHARVLKGVLAAALVVTLGTAHSLGLGKSALEHVEHLVDVHGYGLDQVTLKGHKHTPDGDIFDALNIQSARTLFSFDMGAAKVRVEQLPWVDRATLRRSFPNTLDVTVVEHQPAVLWHGPQSTILLDRNGRRLGHAPPRFEPHTAPKPLLVLSGADADAHTDSAFRLIDAFPGVIHRLDRLERVAGRRWTVHLATGVRLHLPASQPEDALRLALELERQGQLGQARDIDLRTPGHVVVLDPKPHKEPDPTPGPRPADAKSKRQFPEPAGVKAPTG